MRITAKSSPDGPRSVVTYADGSPVDSDAAKEALDPLGFTVAEVGDAGGAALATVRPGKIVAIGLNYADHARETGQEIPTEPILFNKAASAICGYGDIHHFRAG